MSDFKAAFGFCATLYDDLIPGGSLILRPEDELRLCNLLGAGDDATNLIVESQGQHEIIRVACDGDGVYVVGRAQEGTMELSFPVGAGIRFDWTPQNMIDQLACVQAEEAGENAPIKIPGYTATLNDEGQWCYEPDDDTSDGGGTFEWFDCGWRYYIENGEVKREPAPPSMNLTPGVYPNATVTVNADGKIVDIQKGCPVVYESKCASCDCEDTTP